MSLDFPQKIVATTISFLCRPGKLRAFALHGISSAFVVTAILLAVYWAWYPNLFFWLDGGAQVARLLIGVDLVLGPLLTLMTIERSKRTLKLDFSMIIGLQVAAIVYGVSVLYTHRPASLVLHDNQLYAVTWAQVIEGEESQEAVERLRAASPRPLVILNLDRLDRDRRYRVITAIATGGAPPYVMAEHYIYAEGLLHSADKAFVHEKLKKASIDIEAKAASDPEVNMEFQSFLLRAKKARIDHRSMYYLPVQFRYGEASAIVDRHSLALVDWLR